MLFKVIFSMLCFALVNCHNDLREILFSDERLTSVSDLQHTEDSFIHVAFTLTNVARKSKHLQEKNLTVDFQIWGEKSKLQHQFERMLESLLITSGSKNPLHLILLTDQESVSVLRQIILDQLGKYLSETVIRSIGINNEWKNIFKLPKIRYTRSITLRKI